MVKRTMGRRPAPGESPLPLQVHDRSIDSCVVSFGWPRNSWHSIYTSFIPLFSNIGDMFHLCPLILCHVFIGLGGGGWAGLWSARSLRFGWAVVIPPIVMMPRPLLPFFSITANLPVYGGPPQFGASWRSSALAQ